MRSRVCAYTERGLFRNSSLNSRCAREKRKYTRNVSIFASEARDLFTPFLIFFLEKKQNFLCFFLPFFKKKSEERERELIELFLYGIPWTSSWPSSPSGAKKKKIFAPPGVLGGGSSQQTVEVRNIFISV